ncbi:MAG TPA: carboxylating nicotinate-nucleotide diphosphorylase [Polyangiaceae bacterium]
MDFPIPLSVLDPIILRALEEDLGSGDITTDACIPEDAKAVADARARGPIVVCGGTLFRRVFELVDASLSFESKIADGTIAKKDDVLWTVKGSARSILKGERVALNFTQRLCGIATATRTFVDAVPAGKHTRIIDTRKTTPGLRVLERYAVRCGGGKNHRDNLGSAILIKDNHVAACGGITAAITRSRAHAPHTSRIECEVDSLEQLDEALAAGADIVLLDNMPNDVVAEGVKRCKNKAITEISGGITLSRITALANMDVDLISLGSITHSVISADLGVDFRNA